MFSDDSVFIKTSNIASNAKRLNERYNLILKSLNLKNKKILDLGCHNGRWIYVALKLGAKSVIGVEQSKNYLSIAEENLKKFKDFDKKYSLVQDDMLKYLKKCKNKFDIIFCFGVLYHTLDQFEILKECYRINPKLLIIDTTVINYEKNINIIKLNSKEQNLNDINSTVLYVHKNKNDGWEIIPTEKMVDIWLETIGFNYKKIINYNNVVIERDYANKERIVYYCTNKKNIYF